MRRSLPAGAWAALLLAAAPPAFAADHNDGPAAKNDPDADIADVYAWTTTDGKNVNLVMTFVPFATGTARLSDRVQYVFHTRSMATFGAAASTATDVICEFDTAQKMSCWVGTDEFGTVAADDKGGGTSVNGKLKLFAGARDDAFFFNLTGFKETAKAVAAASGTLVKDPAGCPTLDQATQTALVAQLSHGANGAAPKDDFENANIRAIVLQVDKSLLTKGGPILGVYGATHRKP